MIKQIDDDLYQMICKWWFDHNGTPFYPREMSPKRGYISYIADKPVMAGFLYVSDDLTMGLIAYIVANPECSAREKQFGFDEVINEIQTQAKALNIKFLFTTTNQASLSNKFRQSGFIECDTEVVHLLKPVKGE